MSTYAHCCNCQAVGILSEVTRVKNLGFEGNGKHHQCITCNSFNVDVMSEYGLKYELASDTGGRVEE